MQQQVPCTFVILSAATMHAFMRRDRHRTFLIVPAVTLHALIFRSRLVHLSGIDEESSRWRCSNLEKSFIVCEIVLLVFLPFAFPSFILKAIVVHCRLSWQELA